ncbi:MAG: hypothetical protein KF687_06620 [Cyclobacteriaceae bacterium]|nr:hypothetical protein [Cyclobacteriaceae bacterium]
MGLTEENEITDNNGGHNGKWHDAAGRFLKGNPGKKKGTSKNLLRDKIKSFLSENFEQLPDWFEKLKPKEKIDVLLALMPYAVSRLQTVSTDEPETELKITACWDESLIPQQNET